MPGSRQARDLPRPSAVLRSEKKDGVKDGVSLAAPTHPYSSMYSHPTIFSPAPEGKAVTFAADACIAEPLPKEVLESGVLPPNQLSRARRTPDHESCSEKGSLPRFVRAGMEAAARDDARFHEACSSPSDRPGAATDSYGQAASPSPVRPPPPEHSLQNKHAPPPQPPDPSPVPPPRPPKPAPPAQRQIKWAQVAAGAVVALLLTAPFTFRKAPVGTKDASREAAAKAAAAKLQQLQEDHNLLQLDLDTCRDENAGLRRSLSASIDDLDRLRRKADEVSISQGDDSWLLVVLVGVILCGAAAALGRKPLTPFAGEEGQYAEVQSLGKLSWPWGAKWMACEVLGVTRTGTRLSYDVRVLPPNPGEVGQTYKGIGGEHLRSAPEVARRCRLEVVATNLQRSLDQLRAKYSILEAEATSSDAAAESLRSERESLRREISDLRRGYDQTVAALAKVEGEATTLAGELERAKAACEALSQDKHASDVAADALRQSIADLRQVQSSRVGDNAAARTKMLSAELEAVKAELSTMKARHAEAVKQQEDELRQKEDDHICRMEEFTLFAKKEFEEKLAVEAKRREEAERNVEEARKAQQKLEDQLAVVTRELEFAAAVAPPSLSAKPSLTVPRLLHTTQSSRRGTPPSTPTSAATTPRSGLMHMGFGSGLSTPFSGSSTAQSATVEREVFTESSSTPLLNATVGESIWG